MIRKFTHIFLVLSFLFGGIVSVAPMAFCQMTEAKQDVPDCCQEPQEKTQHCSQDTETMCPICTQNICNSVASPQLKVSAEPNTSSVVLLAVIHPTDVPTTIYRSASHQITAATLTDSDPPIYIRNQVFRL